MQTAGLSMSDVWASRVLRERGVDVFRDERREAELSVLVHDAQLKHHGPDKRFRPYLHLTGDVSKVVFHDPLPYDITEVTYPTGTGETIDAFYEFTDAQLVTLARKGYFRQEFQVPHQITGIEWELPARANVLIAGPDAKIPGSVPLVFVTPRDAGNLEITEENSGYDLTEYFADVSSRTVDQGLEAADERTLRARSDAINSLFREEDLQLSDDEIAPSSVGREPEPTKDEAAASALAAQLAETQAAIEAEQAEYQAERSKVPGSPEHLYEERVAAVFDAPSPENDTEQAAPIDLEKIVDAVGSASPEDLEDAATGGADRTVARQVRERAQHEAEARELRASTGARQGLFSEEDLLADDEPSL